MVAAVKVIRNLGSMTELIAPDMLKDKAHIQMTGYKIDILSDSTFLAFGLCEHTLKHEIANQQINQMAISRLVTAFKEAFKALIEIGLVHCDVKPINILVKNEVYKLADFGLATFTKLNNRIDSAGGTYSYHIRWCFILTTSNAKSHKLVCKLLLICGPSV